MLKYDRIFNGDSLDYLKKIDNESIDVIFSDPPYGTGDERAVQKTVNKMKFDKNFKSGNLWDYFNDDDDFWKWFIPYLEECDRVLRKGGYIIMWFDRDKINFLSKYLKNNGYKLRNYIADIVTNPVPKGGCISWMNSFGMLGIWIKSGGKFVYNGKELGQHSEHFIWDMNSDGLITRPILQGKERIQGNDKALHPTQKPEHICKDIIEYFSNKNELILDPFMGTGTIPVVAKMLDRHYIGIEKELKYFEVAENRLSLATKINNNLDKKFFKLTEI